MSKSNDPPATDKPASDKPASSKSFYNLYKSSS